MQSSLCETWEFEWDPAPGAKFYELSVKAGTPLKSCQFIVADTRLAMRFPAPVRPSGRAVAIFPCRDHFMEAGSNDASPPGRKIRMERVSDAVDAVDHMEWQTFDPRRLPLARFNYASDSKIRLTQQHMNFKWRRPAQAAGVELALVRTGGADVQKTGFMGRWFHEGEAGDLNVGECDPGSYLVTARCAFPSRRRWGPKINVAWIEVGGTEERRQWESELRETAARRARYEQAARPRSIRENVEVLLEDMSQRRTELRAAPLFASISLGYDCNAHCLHCDEGRVRRPHRVPESLTRDVVELAVPSGLASCELVGGEPLLYSETESVAHAVERRNPDCWLVLSTNGMLLGEQWDRRAATGRLKINVSMDGATKGTFETIRKKLDFTRITGNMRRMHAAAKANPGWAGFSVNFVVMKPNRREIIDLVELAPEIGVSAVHYNLLENPHGSAELEAIDPVSTKEDAWLILRDLRAAKLRAAALSIAFSSRLEPRLLNAYPSLCETLEDTEMLPRDLTRLAEKTGRRDMHVRENLTGDQIGRLEQLRTQASPHEPTDNEQPDLAELAAVDRATIEAPVPSRDADRIDGSAPGKGVPLDRLLPLLDSEFEMRNHAGLSYLRQTAEDRRGLCDYPFACLYLDTYRTYVCCQATDYFLYGHRYDSESPRLADIWNGAFMRKAREKMYANEFEDVCHARCHYFASGGTYSTVRFAANAGAARKG